MTILAERPQVTIEPALEVPAGLDMDARYTVDGYRGVAFYLIGYATEWTEERWILDCDDDSWGHEHDGACYLYDEPEEVERTDQVRAVMVGDDMVHEVDVSDLTEISEEDYCAGCGQVGCKAYG